MNETLNYYNKNAATFAEGTVSVDFEENQNKFLRKLSDGAYILDFGCGSGRDTKYFMERGFTVDATDGSKELCELATKYTGTEVRCMLFEELEAVNKYDGIWACSSILHLSREALGPVLGKMLEALKDHGIIYTSFKYGEFEGERNGRYFTHFTIESFDKYMKELQVVKGMEVVIEELWVTGDVRVDRGNEKWLNLILRKN